jgi:hypothetical protein
MRTSSAAWRDRYRLEHILEAEIIFVPQEVRLKLRTPLLRASRMFSSRMSRAAVRQQGVCFSDKTKSCGNET